MRGKEKPTPQNSNLVTPLDREITLVLSDNTTSTYVIPLARTTQNSNLAAPSKRSNKNSSGRRGRKQRNSNLAVQRAGGYGPVYSRGAYYFSVTPFKRSEVTVNDDGTTSTTLEPIAVVHPDPNGAAQLGRFTNSPGLNQVSHHGHRAY